MQALSIKTLLTATSCVKLRLSLYFQIQTWNSSVFYLLSVNYSNYTCSASASL